MGLTPQIVLHPVFGSKPLISFLFYFVAFTSFIYYVLAFFIDKLPIIGNSLNSANRVIHTLNGLTTEYRKIFAALRSRESPIEFYKIHEKLMGFDMLLHRVEPSMSDPPVVIANATSRLCGHQHQSRYHRIVPLILLLKQMKHMFYVKIATNVFKIKGYPRRNGV